MRIVIIRTNTADFGKIGSYNVQEVGLANALIKKGYNVNVIYLNRNVNEVTVDETYSFVFYLPHRNFGLHGMFDVELLEQFNPEGIIYFSDNQLWAKNVINWCKMKDIKCVHYMGNVLSDNPYWLNQLYTKMILMRNIKSYNYSINIAKTEKVHQEMDMCGVPFTKVIPVGLDDTVLQDKINLDIVVREELGFSKDEMVLLFVGRLVDYKRPLLACDITKQMNKNGVKTRLVIVGNGPMEEELISYIEKENINSYVKYIGRVPYKEMYKYMVSSNCFINLSHKEIFGMAILEAMYYGLPVVAHVAPGPKEVITDKSTGYLLDTFEINTWHETILRASENKSMAQAARNNVLHNYMWNNIANDFLELIEGR